MPVQVGQSEGDAMLAASDTIAVLMPAVNFNLGLFNFADGRALLDAGAAVALATDMGKSADLLIVSTDDYRNMTYLLGGNLVETVIKNGEEILDLS